MIDRICANKSCRVSFKAKAADVKRGWGRFCSKRCKAHRQAQTHGFNSRSSFRATHDGREYDTVDNEHLGNGVSI